MLLCARYLKSIGRLKNDAIVATVMSNIGLEIALRESGIGLVRCPVGDKYVMEEMIARGLSLGGEQSGHVIFSDFLFTGDGLVTALNVLQVMAATGRSLADLASQLTAYPQILLNVRVRARTDLGQVPHVKAVIGDVERRLGRTGPTARPLLRVPSRSCGSCSRGRTRTRFASGPRRLPRQCGHTWRSRRATFGPDRVADAPQAASQVGV